MSAEAYEFDLVLHAQVEVSLDQTAPAHIAASHSTVCVRTGPGSCRNQQYNPHTASRIRHQPWTSSGMHAPSHLYMWYAM